jgi:tripartite-type tricarboxylate transporter receptor subunit TctC
MISCSRRLIGIAIAAACCCLALVAEAAQDAAADYPSKNIVVVVPYAAGGPTDIIVRNVMPHVAVQLGQPIVIEVQAGASGTLGAARVARAAPDGHTLLAADTSMTVAPYVMASPNFDPRRDFLAVGLLARSLLMMVANPQVPARSVAEFVALAKSKPGEITYAHAGTGSPPHLGALAFIAATGVEMVPVTYRGVSVAVNDVVGGHVSMLFMSRGAVASLADAGKVRVLATAGLSRLASMPDVPTFRELGIDLKIVDDGTWFGIVAPAGTPAQIVDRLNAAINLALADSAIRARLEAIDLKLLGGTRAEFARVIERHIAHWSGTFSRASPK